VLGGLSATIYTIVVWLSWQFEFVDRSLDFAEMYVILRKRPIVPVLVCFAVLFVLYLFAQRMALKCSAKRTLVPTIFGIAIGFRLLLLVSDPIQEIDIYRYVWDGAVVRAGVSPFRYSPQQVLDADENSPLADDFGRLVKLRDSSPALHEILRRVHFGQLPTVYPSVSQAVFAAASFTTPTSAGVRTHVVIMRCWLLVFDVATMWLLLLILRHVGKPDAWVLAYAWCPLVMKEFANSGHLDSIAVCLTTAAVYLSLKAFYRRELVGECAGDGCHLRVASATRDALATRQWHATEESTSDVVPGDVGHSGKDGWTAIFAAVLLALAVAAKLYPIVLVPILVFTSLRRLGWWRTLLPAAVFVLLTGVLCAPMLPTSSRADAVGEPAQQRADNFMPPQPDDTSVVAQDPSRGLSTFLHRWEMNDFLFLILTENVKPTAKQPAAKRAWFVVTPEQGREQFVAAVSQQFGIDRRRVPFLLTRFVTAGIFLSLALWWSWRSSNDGNGDRFLESVFLTLAWFWLLLPTQNPWYWIWALPFVPFARNRVWLAMSGCVLLYYLRFWLGYHWPETTVFGTGYNGHAFFDFVVSWVEYGPWFVWLFVTQIVRRRDRNTSSLTQESVD